MERNARAGTPYELTLEIETSSLLPDNILIRRVSEAFTAG
jgi:hypothetical protein